MLRKNIETFLSCGNEWQEAGTVLFGAPFDSTTSYRPGSRFGSSAIRRESYGIESYSPYQDKDLEDIAVFDSGDIELPLGDAALSLAQTEERAAAILEAGKRPFLLGGEHLVTLGASGRPSPSTRISTSSTLTPTPICGTTTWGCSSPTPVCCAAAGSLWATGRFSSSASAREIGRSSAGGLPT